MVYVFTTLSAPIQCSPICFEYQTQSLLQRKPFCGFPPIPTHFSVTLSVACHIRAHCLNCCMDLTLFGWLH